VPRSFTTFRSVPVPPGRHPYMPSDQLTAEGRAWLRLMTDIRDARFVEHDS
jgi:hypothetical protein